MSNDSVVHDQFTPHSRSLRWLYSVAEDHPMAYYATWPLWFSRYFWLDRAALHLVLRYHMTPRQAVRLLGAIRGRNDA